MALEKKPDKKSSPSVGSPLGANRNLDINPPRSASDSADRVGALNEARRDKADPEPETEAASLREQQMADRRLQAKSGQADEEGKGEKEDKVEAAISKATAPIKKATSNLLKQSWLNLVDSFGLTLIWINIHVFLRTVLSSRLFCKLGEEWLGSGPAASTPGGEKTNEKVGQTVGMAEGPALAGLDACCLLLLIIVVGLITMIVGFLENPMRAIMSLLKTIIGNLWE